MKKKKVLGLDEKVLDGIVLEAIEMVSKQLASKYNKPVNLCTFAIVLKLQNKGLKKISFMDSLMVMQEIDLDYLNSLESKIVLDEN